MMSEANKPLSDLCLEIGKQIDLAQQAREVYDWIAENAKPLNESGFDLVFGTVQRWALDETILAICRLFDGYKGTASIKHAINLIPQSHLQDRDRFSKYLCSFGAPVQKLISLRDEELLAFGAELIHKRKPTKEGDERLGRIMLIRDNVIAHTSLSPQDLKLWEADFDFCAAWANGFIENTAAAFKVFGMPTSCRRAKMSLLRLCHQAGIVRSPLFSVA